MDTQGRAWNKIIIFGCCPRLASLPGPFMVYTSVQAAFGRGNPRVVHERQIGGSVWIIKGIGFERDKPHWHRHACEYTRYRLGFNKSKAWKSYVARRRGASRGNPRKGVSARVYAEIGATVWRKSRWWPVGVCASWLGCSLQQSNRTFVQKMS